MRKGRTLSELAPFLRPYGSEEGTALAYVCSNHACALPTSSVDRMLALLGEAVFPL